MLYFHLYIEVIEKNNKSSVPLIYKSKVSVRPIYRKRVKPSTESLSDFK